MFHWRSAIFLFAVFFGTICLLAFRGAYSEDAGFVVTSPAWPVPTFTFEDEKGRSLDLKDFRGRYVLLNLWETSCAPCASEMPLLNALSKKLDHKVYAVIALNEDHDGSGVVKFFFKRHDIDHLPVYADTSGRAPFILHTRGLPTTILVDPHGMEIARLEGAADWTKDTMVSFLETRPQP